jgi:hypothetical protein
MKIKNRTRYDSRVLARVFALVHSWMAKEIGHKLRQWPRLDVEVKYRNSGRLGVSGCATVGGWHMTLRLPQERIASGEGRLRTATLAWVVWHELLHTYGYRHDRFSPPAMYNTDSAERFAFVVEKIGSEMVADAAVKVKVKPTKETTQRARYDRLVANEKAWQSKLKRAQTALRKIAKRKRYYERQLSVAAVNA